MQQSIIQVNKSSRKR